MTGMIRQSNRSQFISEMTTKTSSSAASPYPATTRLQPVPDSHNSPVTPISRFHQRQSTIATVGLSASPTPAATTPAQPSPSKKRFQRLRVRSLSRTRTPKASSESRRKSEDDRREMSVDDGGIPPPATTTTPTTIPNRTADLASPMNRRRNNSAGNLYTIARSGDGDDDGPKDGYIRRSSSIMPQQQQQPGSLSRASRSTLNLFQDAQRHTLRHLSKSWDSLTRVSTSYYAVRVGAPNSSHRRSAALKKLPINPSFFEKNLQLDFVDKKFGPWMFGQTKERRKISFFFLSKIHFFLLNFIFFFQNFFFFFQKFFFFFKNSFFSFKQIQKHKNPKLVFME